ncbi:hypothetical protein DOTSEDRAFT_75730 [Dothistroma septosporum NZE10]|uniref:Uncharacterized protein n=1 Tax=Dothistroma septosporum (strain NZE10 / CBS 128990) TaxID=675120 RepID=N1PBM2_DOTSN|nr:hypothetical protein DOTSEDRAFT_75730 [Dothistroma septosporum NZE10]
MDESDQAVQLFGRWTWSQSLMAQLLMPCKSYFETLDAVIVFCCYSAIDTNRLRRALCVAKRLMDGADSARVGRSATVESASL